MATATLTSIEEYLRTSYSPDCEYVDGLIVERNLGELTHGRIQRQLILYLGNRSEQLRIEVIPEQRVQVSPTRFRVPDVIVIKTPHDGGQIITSPPHICIEILSKDDTMEDMQSRIDDYLTFGVPYIWIVSPRNRKAFVVTSEGMVEAKGGVIETEDPRISVPLADLFAAE
jgi:Uma2 family endonuclease